MLLQCLEGQDRVGMFPSLQDRLDSCSGSCLLINVHNLVLCLRAEFSTKCHPARVRGEDRPSHTFIYWRLLKQSNWCECPNSICFNRHNKISSVIKLVPTLIDSHSTRSLTDLMMRAEPAGDAPGQEQCRPEPQAGTLTLWLHTLLLFSWFSTQVALLPAVHWTSVITPESSIKVRKQDKECCVKEPSWGRTGRENFLPTEIEATGKSGLIIWVAVFVAMVNKMEVKLSI